MLQVSELVKNIEFLSNIHVWHPFPHNYVLFRFSTSFPASLLFISAGWQRGTTSATRQTNRNRILGHWMCTTILSRRLHTRDGSSKLDHREYWSLSAIVFPCRQVEMLLNHLQYLWNFSSNKFGYLYFYLRESRTFLSAIPFCIETVLHERLLANKSHFVSCSTSFPFHTLIIDHKSNVSQSCTYSQCTPNNCSKNFVRVQLLNSQSILSPCFRTIWTPVGTVVFQRCSFV